MFAGRSARPPRPSRTPRRERRRSRSRARSRCRARRCSRPSPKASSPSPPRRLVRLARVAAADVFAGLNDEQRRAVECVRGPVCILAGAGSGKTTTITRRIAHQVRSGAFAAQSILAVTFTTKAAGELVARLEALGVAGVPARTFHAAALVAADGARRPRARRARRRRSGVLRRPRRPRAGAARPSELASEIERAKNRRVTPDALRGAELGERRRCRRLDGARLPPLRGAEGARGARRLRGSAGAGDRDVRDRRRALERFKRRYLAFTVDEYQDVNLLQQTLLDRWLDGRDELCVVGDDYQAIFSFTGATPRYLLDMPRRYPHAEVIRLRAQLPVDAAGARACEPARTAARRRPQDAPRRRRDGPEPTVRACAGPDGELAFVVGEIERCIGGVPYAEMAVLYRINARSADYEQALHHAGIPFQVAGGGFLARPACVRSLRRLDSPGDGRRDRRAPTRRAGFEPDPDPASSTLASSRASRISRACSIWPGVRRRRAHVARVRRVPPRPVRRGAGT